MGETWLWLHQQASWKHQASISWVIWKNWSHSLVVKLFECSSNIALISFLSNDQGETHLPTHIWPQGYYSTKKLWNLKFRGEYILWNSPAHPYLGSRSNSCTGHSTLPFLMARGENNTNDDSDKGWQYFLGLCLNVTWSIRLSVPATTKQENSTRYISPMAWKLVKHLCSHVFCWNVSDLPVCLSSWMFLQKNYPIVV